MNTTQTVNFSDSLTLLSMYVGFSQLSVMKSGCKGEEKEFFKSKIVEMGNLIDAMPKTYEQDGKGQNAVAYLHYFKGGLDWYITEKDMSASEDGNFQAFGSCNDELGYINIEELINHGVELDLHFEPKALKDLK